MQSLRDLRRSKKAPEAGSAPAEATGGGSTAADALARGKQDVLLEAEGVRRALDAEREKLLADERAKHEARPRPRSRPRPPRDSTHPSQGPWALDRCSRCASERRSQAELAKRLDALRAEYESKRAAQLSGVEEEEKLAVQRHQVRRCQLPARPGRKRT